MLGEQQQQVVEAVVAAPSLLAYVGSVGVLGGITLVASEGIGRAMKQFKKFKESKRIKLWLAMGIGPLTSVAAYGAGFLPTPEQAGAIVEMVFRHARLQTQVRLAGPVRLVRPVTGAEVTGFAAVARHKRRGAAGRRTAQVTDDAAHRRPAADVSQVLLLKPLCVW